VSGAEEGTPILPTRYRARQPRGWSFVAGAELLSRELGELLSAATAELAFHGGPADPRERGPAVEWTLLSIQHSPDDRLFAEWQVTMSSVPSAIRHRCREALLSKGFSMARDWLTRQRAPVGLPGSQRLVILMDETSGDVRQEVFDRSEPERLGRPRRRAEEG
jgi:hypothetical protein